MMSDVIDADVAAHYNLGLEEYRLTVDGRPRLEFVRTLELLDRVLPTAPAKVLDVGGATGAYAFPLAERGFTVTIVDPVHLHVERANELASWTGASNRATAHLGDARDLAAFGTGFDAVLMLGPLYHLTSASDRRTAWAQAVMAATPGGVLVAVGISRFASLLDGLKRRLLDDPLFRQIVEQDLATGQHRNPRVVEQPEFFTTAYFHHPDELAAEAIAPGLRDIQLLAVEGPAWMVEDIDDIDNQLHAARATESEPTLLGMSSHILVTGRTTRPSRRNSDT